MARSARLHRGLADPPRTPAAFNAYLKRLRGRSHLGYWVRTPAGELAGVINVSEIVRGSFRSAYLGYYAFSPHDGRGYMFQGLRGVIREAFLVHRLHRLEANIQPDNRRSRSLVRRLGFRREGYSPRYLKIGGRWRDHERWALTIEDWRSGGARAANLSGLGHARATKGEPRWQGPDCGLRRGFYWRSWRQLSGIGSE